MSDSPVSFLVLADWLQAWSPSQRKWSWVWGGSLSCGHMLSTFHYPRPTSFKTNSLLLVLLMEGLSCICNQEIVTLLANRLTTKIPPPPLLHVMLSFLLFWVGPQWELGAMAQRHRLMLKLSWQAKAGSEKLFCFRFSPLCNGSKGVAETWGWPCVHCPVQERSPLALTVWKGGLRSLPSGGRKLPSVENCVRTSKWQICVQRVIVVVSWSI